MNKDKTKKQKKGMLRDLILLGIFSCVMIILLLVFPNKQEPVIKTSWDFFVEMIAILPAVMILMGLFSVWVSKETVVKYLGKKSGLKGMFLSILFGALPTGPLYVAFPMASTMIKKGARISNIIIFLSAWACIKIPQEMVEMRFLGLKFMASRLLLTIIFVFLMGLLVERIIEWSDRKNSKLEGGKINAGI